MTCRHKTGDPACSSYQSRLDNLTADYHAYVVPTLVSETPDASNFEIEDAKDIGPHLVLRVRYPNCATCAFEGQKVMVFLDTSLLEAIKWKTIDPHFRPAPETRLKHEAPPPAARFPASPQGWSDALEYANRKTGGAR